MPCILLARDYKNRGKSMYNFEYVGTQFRDLNIKDLGELFTPFNGSKELPLIRIFFLYEKKDASFYKELSVCFPRINSLSGQDIDLWTAFHVDENLVHTTVDFNAYIDLLKNQESFKILNPAEINTNVYDCMKWLAKIFKCDAKLPVFIIWNTETNEYITIKKIPKFPLLNELRIMIYLLKGFNYDWERIVSYYDEICTGLNTEGNICRAIDNYVRVARYGFTVEELKNDGYNIESINELISKYSHGKPLLPLKYFLCDFKYLCAGDPLLQSKMQGKIDSYLNFLSSKKKELIVPGLNKTSVLSSTLDYFNKAYWLFEELTTYSTDLSLAAYCIGKAVEDELNLGVVQLIRKHLGVAMPENFNKHVRDKKYTITHTNSDGKQDKINYNDSKESGSMVLRYPAISKSNSILFDSQYAILERNLLCALFDFIKEEFPTGTYDALRTIIKHRNNAVHSSSPISKDDFLEMKDALEKLVGLNFFEKNTRIRKSLSR